MQVSTEQLQRMIDDYEDSVFFKALTRRQQEVIVLIDVLYPSYITDGPEEAVDVPLDSKFVPFRLHLLPFNSNVVNQVVTVYGQ